jgi:hypothetical protein
MRRLVRCLTSAILLALSTTLMAQQHPNVARGFDIGRSYQMNGIDNVNLFNGSLTVTIPIGQRYHVNGGLQYGLTLVYSGNVWDTIQNDVLANVTYPNRRSNAGIGWLLSLGRLFPHNTFPIQESFFWNYESPDGALHGFPTLADQTTGSFFTTDGSYLRLTINGSDRTVEFPDGTSQVFKELNPSDGDIANLEHDVRQPDPRQRQPSRTREHIQPLLRAFAHGDHAPARRRRIAGLLHAPH